MFNFFNDEINYLDDFLENNNNYFNEGNFLTKNEFETSNNSYNNKNYDLCFAFDDYNSEKDHINLMESKEIEKLNDNEGTLLKMNLLPEIKNSNEEKDENLNKTGKSTDKNSINKNKVINKKLGRKRKEDLYEGNEGHNKESDDNIRIKFKRLFIKNLILFINFLIDRSNNVKLLGLEIKKIESSYVSNTKKENNLQMLDLTVGEFLSKEICKKYKRCPKDNNIKLIKLIYDEDEKVLIKVLDRKVRDLMKIFSKDKVRNNIFKYYKRLKNYIDELYINKNKEKENYIKKFIYQAKNYEQILLEIDGRKEGNVKKEEKVEKENKEIV